MGQRMTPLQRYLQECRDRAERSSPGPWTVNSDHFTVCSTGNSNEDDQHYSVHMNGYAARDGAHSDAKDDAAFIAASRTDIPLLCGIVQIMIDSGIDERVRDKIERLIDE